MKSASKMSEPGQIKSSPQMGCFGEQCKVQSCRQQFERGMLHVQVFKKQDMDADELMGLSSAKRGGKKSKKGVEKAVDKPVRPCCTSLS